MIKFTDVTAEVAHMVSCYGGANKYNALPNSTTPYKVALEQFWFEKACEMVGNLKDEFPTSNVDSFSIPMERLHD